MFSFFSNKQNKAENNKDNQKPKYLDDFDETDDQYLTP